MCAAAGSENRGRGHKAKKGGQPLEAGKGKEKGSPLDPPKGAQSC